MLTQAQKDFVMAKAKLKEEREQAKQLKKGLSQLAKAIKLTAKAERKIQQKAYDTKLSQDWGELMHARKERQAEKSANEPPWYKKAHAGTSAFFGATGRAIKRGYISSLRPIHDHYEDMQLKATNPELYAHLKLRESCAIITRKMAQVGPTHKKTAKLLETSQSLLYYLEDSWSPAFGPDVEAETQAARADMIHQIRRLQESLIPVKNKEVLAELTQNLLSLLPQEEQETANHLMQQELQPSGN